MNNSDYHEILHEDMGRLEKMLRQLCQEPLEISESGRLKVLDLACGECFEAETLARLLPSFSAEPAAGLQVDFVGLDLREREIARAAERCSADAQANYRFQTQNGLKLPRQRDLPEAFDVVFVRHQNYYHSAKDWHHLFQHGLEKLAPGGKLVITSYFDREHELAKAAIDKVGGQLLRDLANLDARALSFPGKHVDKRLAIFTRKETPA